MLKNSGAELPGISLISLIDLTDSPAGLSRPCSPMSGVTKLL